jgi:undecaprenyl-diphosphatase
LIDDTEGAILDLILIIKALILGLVEAASEFLPISSTGHLIIVGDFLDFTGPRAEAFEIFIQLGAILSVVWIYRRRLSDTIMDLSDDPKARRLVANLAIAFTPAAVLGFFLHDQITRYLFNPVTVAGALVLGGIAILLIERYARAGRIQTVDEMSWKDAVVVGVAQSVSLVPGVSRAGATIMGGMLGGLSRFAATEFSFFLAIPTMFAATGYSLFKAWGTLTVADMPVFAVGFVAAFLGGLAVVRFLLAYVSHNSFAPFAYYRIVFGGLLLLYFHYHPWVGKGG